MITDHRNSNPVLEISSVKHERVKANENRASFSREVQESRHGIRMRDVRGVSLDQGENMKSGLIPWTQVEKTPKVRVSTAGISIPLF